MGVAIVSLENVENMDCLGGEQSQEDGGRYRMDPVYSHLVGSDSCPILTSPLLAFHGSQDAMHSQTMMLNKMRSVDLRWRAFVFRRVTNPRSGRSSLYQH